MEYPLKDVPQPHPHDVLCGRGGGTNNHVGNTHWRMLVTANKELYVTLSKRQKMLLSKSIVNAVRSQVPPGRFLQKDSKTQLWFDVGDQRAQEKTSQALREGAPEIREKVNSPDTANNNHSNSNTNTNSSKQKQDSSAPTAQSSPPQHQAQHQTHVQHQHAHMPPQPGMGMMQMPPQQNGQQQQQQQQQQQPMMVLSPQAMAHAQANGYQIMQTMGRNEHGVLVPVQVVMPPTAMPAPIQAQGRLSERKKNNRGKSNSSHDDDEDDHPIPVVPVNAQQQQQYYEQASSDVFVEPPAPLEAGGGFSLGTIDMSEYETQLEPGGGFSFGDPDPALNLTQLEGGTFSFGTVMSYKKEPESTHGNPPADARQQQQRVNFSQDAVAPQHHQQQHQQAQDIAPVDGGLEPAGLSIGSLMSIGTVKLETAGLSIGSMMSVSVKDPPSAVDGGLEAVGTSFGSLSLATEDQTRLLDALHSDPTPTFEATPMTMLNANKSKGSLLDCSDTDSDGEEELSGFDSGLKSRQKSANFEKMQATVYAQSVNTSTSGSAAAAVPPPLFPGGAPSTFNMPAATSLNRDFSQMSAISVGEDFAETILPGAVGGGGFSSEMPPPAAFHGQDGMPPPPPALKKQTSEDEWEDLESTYLNRGTSLAEEYAQR